MNTLAAIFAMGLFSVLANAAHNPEDVQVTGRSSTCSYSEAEFNAESNAAMKCHPRIARRIAPWTHQRVGRTCAVFSTATFICE
jgi:hypothetical protein